MFTTLRLIGLALVLACSGMASAAANVVLKNAKNRNVGTAKQQRARRAIDRDVPDGVLSDSELADGLDHRIPPSSGAWSIASPSWRGAGSAVVAIPTIRACASIAQARTPPSADIDAEG